jgi:hypothetical protein
MAQLVHSSHLQSVSLTYGLLRLNHALNQSVRDKYETQKGSESDSITNTYQKIDEPRQGNTENWNPTNRRRKSTATENARPLSVQYAVP